MLRTHAVTGIRALHGLQCNTVDHLQQSTEGPCMCIVLLALQHGPHSSDTHSRSRPWRSVDSPAQGQRFQHHHVYTGAVVQ